MTVAHVLLFHHALGLTDGVRSFADRLRDGGHTVTVPDLYDGRRFATVDDGVAHAEQVGFEAIVAAGAAVAQELPPDLVYAGMSLGVMPAQKLAQTRPGARAAVLYHGAVPATTFAPSWPAEVGLQLHVMERDDWGEPDVVADLAAAVDGADLRLYPGSAHLFTDDSHDEFDADATDLVVSRTLEFLSRLA